MHAQLKKAYIKIIYILIKQLIRTIKKAIVTQDSTFAKEHLKCSRSRDTERDTSDRMYRS